MADQTLMRMQRETLLQEGVSCALAALHSIEAASLFRAAPGGDAEAAAHNHGCWLIAMLSDHLRGIQRQVDALDGTATTNPAGAA
jgi:hypothetical protein